MISVDLKQEPASPSELPQVILVFIHSKCIITMKKKENEENEDIL